MIRIQLFGSPLVFSDHTAVKLLRRKSRAVLFYLAAQPKPVHRDKLVNIFWVDEPRSSALQVLRTTLHGLRGELGDNLVTQENLISLSKEVWVDSREFEGALTESNFDPIRWDEQLDNYHGAFLEGFTLPGCQPFEDWMLVEREHFQRIVVRALIKLSAWHEDQQDYKQALQQLIRALNLDPLQEDLQRESIRLQYLAGDRPGAIRRYDDLRKLLDEEMGVPPMAETRALYDAVISDRVESLVRPKIPAKPLRATSRPVISQGIELSPKPILPFIGRKSEIELARAGLLHRQLILVEGEPGIGKTRFAEEFLKGLPGLTLATSAHELEQNLPYQPIIALLRGLFRGQVWQAIQPAIRREISAVWWAEIIRLVPEQGEAASPMHYTEAVRPGLTEIEEARLWEGVYQFFLTLSRQQKLNIFLDDIHWADSSSIGLIGYLVRQQYLQPVAFIATARPFSSRSRLMSLVLALAREAKILRINLTRLTAEDFALVTRNQGQPWPDGFAQWLLQYSEGNPFVFTELIRSAQVAQHGAEGFDYLRLMKTQVVPEGVYSLVQARLSRLSEPARRILDVSVAAGREFDFEVVIRAAGLSEMVAVDALDELVSAGLIMPLDGFRFTFDHHLTMEVAFREVGELRHRLLHRRVAEAIEGQNRDNLDKVAGLLAWHYQEGNDPVRAAGFAFRAGSQSARLAAWGEATAFYQQALVGMSGSGRIKVMIALAEALFRSGQFAQSTDAYRDVLFAAQTSLKEDQLLEIRLALARTLLPQARFAEVIEQAKEILASGNNEHFVSAELIWGTALSVEGADLDQAKTHLLAALREWEQGNRADLFPWGQAHFELGSLTAQQGDLEQAILFYRKALAAAQQSGNDEMDELQGLVLNNLAYHLLLMKDPTAREFAETGLSLAMEKGLIGIQPYLLSTLGEIELATGNFDQAEEYFNDGLNIAERLAAQERIAGLNANLGLVAIARQQPALAIYRLSKALGLADSLGTRHLAAQIRLWLTPLLPQEEALMRLQEARSFAESSGRARLLEEVKYLESQLED